MAIKLSDRKGTLFISLYENEGEISKTYSDYLEKQERIMSSGYYNYTEAEKAEAHANIADAMEEVVALYNKVKFFEKPEKYAVNGWGYDQTNYENIVVIGKLGGAYLAILEGSDYVYSIGAKKFDTKDDWTCLDGHGVRYTSWKEPYTKKELQDNHEYNMYYGH